MYIYTHFECVYIYKRSTHAYIYEYTHTYIQRNHLSITREENRFYTHNALIMYRCSVHADIHTHIHMKTQTC